MRFRPASGREDLSPGRAGPVLAAGRACTCGRCFSRQAGFTQVTNVGTDAFHCERRCRVLLRDKRLFGNGHDITPRFSGPVMPEISFPRYGICVGTS